MKKSHSGIRRTARTTAELLLEDAFSALDAEPQKKDVLACVINDGRLLVKVSGNPAKTKREQNFGQHIYDRETKVHTIEIYRSTRKMMLEAMIHELIHAWQYETKLGWVDAQDRKHPDNLSMGSYALNAAENEARAYGSLASAFIKSDLKAERKYCGKFAMIREDLIKAEQAIERKDALRAAAHMLRAGDSLTKCEVSRSRMMVSQTARTAALRARYLSDIADLEELGDKKGNH